VIGKIVGALKKELDPLVRIQLRQELSEQIRQELTPVVRAELAAEFIKGGQMAEEWRILLSQQTHAMREEIEPSIRREIALELGNQLRPQIEYELRAELEQRDHDYIEELKARRRDESLLEYFTHDKIEATRSEAVDQLKSELHSSVLDSLRCELTEAVRISLREELRPVLMRSSDFHTEVRKLLIAEMSDGIRRELMQELRAEVFESLSRSMRTEVEGSLRGELTLSMVESIANDRGGSLAAILEQSRFHIEHALRKKLQSEEARNAVDNFAEWLWAHSNLQESHIQQLITRAREEFCSPVSGALPRSNGFHRAQETMTCSTSGAEIVPGEYFIQVAGKIHKLPSSYEQAEQLAKQWYYAGAGSIPEARPDQAREPGPQALEEEVKI
jgi:hypothetical protein